MDSLDRSSEAERRAVNADVAGSTPADPARHTELLGMSVSTAANRLKKMMMLHLAQQLELDDCYRCGKTILEPEDCTLDHKEPWRDASAELFWDLDNIAFSHSKCNSAAGRKPTKKVGPPGTSWCCQCKTFPSVSDFGPGKRDGLDAICRPCHRKRVENYAKRNPRFACPSCRYQMRKKCQKCGYELPMAEYMAMRRKEGVGY